MDKQQIIQTIRTSASLLGQTYDGFALKDIDDDHSDYPPGNALIDFKRDLTEAGNKLHIVYLDYSCPPANFFALIKEMEMPVVTFRQQSDDHVPLILYRHKKKLQQVDISTGDVYPLDEQTLDELYRNQDGHIVFLGIFSYKSLVSDDPEAGEKQKELTPVQRLFRLLSEDRKDIYYIYIYAIFIGLISLSLPLGIQATISLVSGGVVFSSVYVLIGLVIAGVLAVGGLQVMQITLVEYLQRRVFTKAAFEFAFRVPRIKVEALTKVHTPELINRFFDILTIQKGLPKLLIDFSSATIQILFGLLLLSFYHPFFVFFGLLLVGLLVLIFFLTGPRGLQTSLKESKFKYKVVYWLEELARTLNSFKLSGNTTLPTRKTDYNVNNYLKNRKAHFSILVYQYIFFILFKALVTGGLLIIGTILVIQREITLGQFVASEVIIILILNSVEKIIMYLDIVYDMLTAVDKIATVTDLPLEKSGGFNLPRKDKGMKIITKNLSYRYAHAGYALKDINLNIEPGECVCIAGVGGSGKTTLTNTLAGLHTGFEGSITMDGFSLRDLDLTNLRDMIGKNVSPEDIFEGTVLDNLLLSKPKATIEDVLWALEEVGIHDQINSLPEGLHTQMVSSGKGLSSSLINKIILARCLVKKPRLLILNDFFQNFPRPERLRLISKLTKPHHPWTLIAVSNDPLIMATCDSVVVLENGSIRDTDSFEALMKKESLYEIVT